MTNTKNIDLAHFALVTARNETGAQEVMDDLAEQLQDATTDGIATGLSRALVALEAYDYEPFERKGIEQAIALVRSLLEATVDP